MSAMASDRQRCHCSVHHQWLNRLLGVVGIGRSNQGAESKQADNIPKNAADGLQKESGIGWLCQRADNGSAPPSGMKEPACIREKGRPKCRITYKSGKWHPIK